MLIKRWEVIVRWDGEKQPWTAKRFWTLWGARRYQDFVSGYDLWTSELRKLTRRRKLIDAIIVLILLGLVMLAVWLWGPS